MPSSDFEYYETLLQGAGYTIKNLTVGSLLDGLVIIERDGELETYKVDGTNTVTILRYICALKNLRPQ